MSEEEIKERAFELVKESANGVDVRDDFGNLVDEYVNSGSRFRVGQMVWLLDEQYDVVNAEIISLGYSKFTQTFHYRLSEKSGRNVGEFAEYRLFSSFEELRDFIMKKFEKR